MQHYFVISNFGKSVNEKKLLLNGALHKARLTIILFFENFKTLLCLKCALGMEGLIVR